MVKPLTRPRLCFVVASDMTAKAFLLDHLRALSKCFDVTLVLNTKAPDLLADSGIEGHVVPLGIERNISLRRDLGALLYLIRFFRRNRFDAVHSVTPKAGLLAMMAAWMAGVPIRTHTFTGQVWVTRKGTVRRLLKSLDGLTARLSTCALADSASQLDFLIAEGVVDPAASGVLASGSISGVDTTRFRYDAETRERIRREMGLEDDVVLLLHLGRLTIDKGVLDLAQAFDRASTPGRRLHLLFVGPDEANLKEMLYEAAGASRERMSFLGFTDKPESYMSAADVLCLPSYREGFGSVIIEAAAAGIPSVASRIYGVVDAVEDGVSGLLHQPHDVAAIESLIGMLADNPEERRRLGEQAQARVMKLFRKEVVVGALCEYYETKLSCFDES